jgi:hypothetical protein
MIKIIIAFVFLVLSSAAMPDDDVNFRVSIPIDSASGPIFGKPKIGMRANKFTIDFKSSNHFVFSLGRVTLDTSHENWIVQENEMVDIDLTNIYNYNP